ncbi:leucine-rich repeat extensin-like protein 5 [Salmo salar]|uniref:Leucine-rich repeat extensin-like protein 5 n=1 Tax=Salmo salar TaxID=8030 RepID=A0ABM3DVF7_SALSA|nr:leucine-rich repeat extensin-like protein 5 [Salmo salar]
MRHPTTQRYLSPYYQSTYHFNYSRGTLPLNILPPEALITYSPRYLDTRHSPPEVLPSTGVLLATHEAPTHLTTRDAIPATTTQRAPYLPPEALHYLSPECTPTRPPEALHFSSEALYHPPPEAPPPKHPTTYSEVPTTQPRVLYYKPFTPEALHHQRGTHSPPEAPHYSEKYLPPEALNYSHLREYSSGGTSSTSPPEVLHHSEVPLPLRRYPHYCISLEGRTLTAQRHSHYLEVHTTPEATTTRVTSSLELLPPESGLRGTLLPLHRRHPPQRHPHPRDPNTYHQRHLTTTTDPPPSYPQSTQYNGILYYSHHQRHS